MRRIHEVRPGKTAKLDTKWTGPQHFPSRLQPWHELLITQRFTFQEWQSQNITPDMKFIEQGSTDDICIISSPYITAAAVSASALRIPNEAETVGNTANYESERKQFAINCWNRVADTIDDLAGFLSIQKGIPPRA